RPDGVAARCSLVAGTHLRGRESRRVPCRHPRSRNIAAAQLRSFEVVAMGGPVVVNNPDSGNNNGLLLGIVLTIVVLAGVWFFIFGPGRGGSGTNNNGGGGGNNPVPTINVPQGS